MTTMPAIPGSTRDSIITRLNQHARQHWPQLDKVQVSYRSQFAYAAGILPGGEQIPLFRLRYGGSAHSFGFAIYSAARDRYEDAVLLTGLPVGTPQEALDTAATVHLAALGHQPPQNLQRGPLKLMALPPEGVRAPRSLLSRRRHADDSPTGPPAAASWASGLTAFGFSPEGGTLGTPS